MKLVLGTVLISLLLSSWGGSILYKGKLKSIISKTSGFGSVESIE